MLSWKESYPASSQVVCNPIACSTKTIHMPFEGLGLTLLAICENYQQRNCPTLQNSVESISSVRTTNMSICILNT